MRERWLGLDKFMSIPALNTPSSQRTLGPRSKSTGVCNLGSSFRWHDVFFEDPQNLLLPWREKWARRSFSEGEVDEGEVSAGAMCGDFPLIRPPGTFSLKGRRRDECRQIWPPYTLNLQPQPIPSPSPLSSPKSPQDRPRPIRGHCPIVCNRQTGRLNCRPRR